MKLRSLIVAGAALSALAVASPAQALDTGDQPVLGTPSGLLALGGDVAVAAPLTLTPGQDNTGTGLLTVTTFGTWTLKVLDVNASTGHGHLLPSDLVPSSGLCSATAALAAPLSVVAGTGVGNLGTISPSGTKDLSSSASAQTLATGSNISIVANNYTQPVGGNEQLDPLCGYRMTARYSVSS